MRVSIDKRDPGYKALSGSYQPFLNGEAAKDVVTADEEQGIIVRYKRDAAGKLAVAPDGMHYVLETVEGLVEIRIVDQMGRDLKLAKVKIERNASGDIEVLVYSQIKPAAIRRGTIDAKTADAFKADQIEGLRKLISVTAGAAAEHCCEQYGDVFDPSDVANLAVEEFGRFQSLEAIN